MQGRVGDLEGAQYGFELTATAGRELSRAYIVGLDMQMKAKEKLVDEVSIALGIGLGWVVRVCVLVPVPCTVSICGGILK